MVWVPECKLLFAGDVIANGCTPFMVGGSVQGTLAALERVRALAPEVVVPGHGEVCGAAAIDDAYAYAKFLQKIGRETFATGVSPLQAAYEVDLGRFGEWLETYRLIANLHRAHSELRGEPPGKPLPLGDIFQEMMQFNGGALSCFA